MDSYLFAGVSFATVLIYYAVAKKLNWTQFKITNLETAYWNAFQAFIWTLGTVALRNGPTPSILASAAILPTAIIYGLISEQPDMQFNLQTKSFTPAQIAVLVIVSILAFIHIVITFMKCDMATLAWKLLPLLGFIIWLINWIAVNNASVSTETSTQKVQGGYSKMFKKYEWGGVTTTTTNFSYSMYIHHWMIATLGFLTTITDDIYSQIISGIFWGVFCQEASAYGIMIPSSLNTTSSSTFTPTYLGPGGTQQQNEFHNV